MIAFHIKIGILCTVKIQKSEKLSPNEPKLMTFHISHIHDYERFLAVELGSSRIRTWVFDIESFSPELMGFSSVRQNKKNMIHWMVTDLRWVTLSIDRSIIQASQKTEEIPTDVILGFSSSQLISDYLTTQYIRKTSEPISMNEIDTMVKKIEKSSFERVRIEAKEKFGITHDDLRLVSSTITNIEIDGRSITNPIGFTWNRIRISLLNLFAPASEFNIVRSVASHLHKNVISLIPIPLVFPKILEKHDYIQTRTCVLDVGSFHTTIICIENNQIIALETFPIGTEILIQTLGSNHPELTLLQIEHMLSHDEYHETRQESLRDFFEYIIDTFYAFTTDNVPQFEFQSLFVHGSIFSTQKVFDVFVSEINNHGQKISIKRFSELLDCDSDEIVTRWLADIATELLMVKKDPLVRILRYVLYNYE